MNTRNMRKQQSNSNYSLHDSNNVNLKRVLRPLKNINYFEEDGNFDDIKDLDYYPELDEDDSDDDDDYVDENEDEFNYSFLKNKMTNTNDYSEDILDGGIMNQESDTESDTESDKDSDYIPSDSESDDDIIEYNYKNTCDKSMVNVCKRRFENGKVIYTWVKMSRHEAEQEQDPDYVEEEN